jgi:hypothetical protein
MALEPIECASPPGGRSRCCRAISALPLVMLAVLLAWVWYAAFVSVGVGYLFVRLHAYALFALHSVAFTFLWSFTCWSLVVTTNRGPGFVEKGTRREQDVGLVAAGHVGRRRDSGVGSDLDPNEAAEHVQLLAASEAHDDLPFDRIVQKASMLTGFDAKEAHPRHVDLPGDGLLTAKADGSVRYCRKVRGGPCLPPRLSAESISQCQSVKPDRAHHCSICNHCVLLMGAGCSLLPLGIR